MRIKRQSVNVNVKRGEEGVDDAHDPMPVECVIDDMMECDGDEIASEHQSNDAGGTTQRANKLKHSGFSGMCLDYPNRAF